MVAPNPKPAPVERRWSEWTIVVVGALVVVAGLYTGLFVANLTARRPVVVALDAVLTLLAFVVGALAWRGSPRQAVVRVLGFATTSSVVFAGTCLWLARDVTLIGEGYADIIMSMFLYVCGVAGFGVAALAGNFIADRATRGPAPTSARRVRRAAQASLAVLVFVAILGTHAVLRRPRYDRWLTSLPLRADFGAPETWPVGAWSTVTTDGGAVKRYRDVRVDGQYLRVYGHPHDERFRGTTVCWLGLSVRETPAEWSSGAHECTRSSVLHGAPLRVRRDHDRGLWIVDHGGRHDSGAFNDLGARVGPTYASILSSAAPPASWVVSAWVALLFATALLRWPRPRGGAAVPLVAPYRPRPAADEPDDPAQLRDAFAVTVCALHAAPLAAYFLRAALG